MTALVGVELTGELGGSVEVGGGIAAGGLAEAALNGQKGIRLGAPNGNSDSNAGSSAQSFRSNWQLIVNGWGAGADTGTTANPASGNSSQVGHTGENAEHGGEWAPGTQRTFQVKPPAANQTGAAFELTARLQAAQRAGVGPSGKSAADSENASAVTEASDPTADKSHSANTGKRQEAAQGSDAGPETTVVVSGFELNAPPSFGVHALMPAAAMQERAAESLPGSSSSFGTAQEPARDPGAMTDSAHARKGASIGAAQAGLSAGARSRVAGGQTTDSLTGRQQEDEANGVETEWQLVSPEPASAAITSLSLHGSAAETSRHGLATTEMSAGRVGDSGLAAAGNTSTLRGDDWDGSADAATSIRAAAGSAAGPVGAGQTAQATTRVSRGNIIDGSSQAAHVALAQEVNSGADAAAMVRDPAGVHAGASGTAGQSTVPGAAQPGTAQGTFAAMDANSGVGTPGWIHAGSQQAEAGFQDPSLGWVGVRADLSGGGVHASLLPGSAEAAQALSGHLAGLNTYLAEQHTPVATLSMAAPHGSATENGAGQGMGQGMNPGAGQNSGRNAAAESQTSLAPGPAGTADPRSSGAAAQSSAIDALTLTGDQRGTHISVMA